MARPVPTPVASKPSTITPVTAPPEPVTPDSIEPVVATAATVPAVEPRPSVPVAPSDTSTKPTPKIVRSPITVALSDSVLRKLRLVAHCEGKSISRIVESAVAKDLGDWPTSITFSP
jgi:hypothetical protein